MIRRISRALVVALALATTMALSGCSGPVHGTDAMVEESERVLAHAEEFIPEIAQTLGLTIVEAESDPYWNPGSEGLPRSLVFVVRGELDGELPTQRALQDAVSGAGLVEILSVQSSDSRRPGTDEAPMVVAETEDGLTQFDIKLITGTYRDGFRFSVHTVERFNISDDAYYEYFPDLIPEFDQSLVEPAP